MLLRDLVEERDIGGLGEFGLLVQQRKQTRRFHLHVVQEKSKKMRIK